MEAKYPGGVVDVDQREIHVVDGRARRKRRCASLSGERRPNPAWSSLYNVQPLDSNA